MNLTSRRYPIVQRLSLLGVCTAILTSPVLRAAEGDAPVPAAEEKKKETPVTVTPAEKPTPSKKEVEAAAKSESYKTDDGTIMLSPFEVVEDNKGYAAGNTASGTRLNSRLEDIASAISVVTKQQLQDMAAVDINDIFRTEASTEGLYQYTEFGNDRGVIVDTASNNPEAANRIRGMGVANLSYGGMSVSGAIPIDTYNVDSVEISRGANANIFGIGSTSGTVNLNIATGNMNRDFSKFSIRADSYGGLRETFDINRVLWRNKLGLRVLGVYDDVGFIRKPSFDVTKRFTIALRAQPFRQTSIKVSYETYRNKASRPNMMTPRQTVSLWQSMGSYTWDPSTWTVRDLNGNPVGSATNPSGVYVGATGGTNGANQLRTDFNFFGGSNMDSNLLRPGIGYINGQIAYFSTNQNGVNGNQRLVFFATPGIRTNVPDKINPQTGQPYGLLESPIDQLVSVNGDAGQAFYDWTEHNINAPNFSTRSSDMLKFEVEQFLLNTPTQQAAVQFAGFYEQIENNSWNFIGNGGDGIQAIVQLDVNRTLPNGQPNPGYLRPFVAGNQPQRYRRPENNSVNKFQAAYLVDFTQNEGWSKWAGKHNFVGYSEYRERQYAPNALRYRSQIAPTVPTSDNQAFLGTRYYLGDGVGYNIDSPTTTPPMEGVFPYTAWTGTPAAFVTQDTNISQLHFAFGTERHRIRTAGALWQGFFWDGKIIPTLGYREDTIRFSASKPFPTYSIGNVTNISNPDGGLFDFQNTYFVTNPKTRATKNEGLTRQQGIVVKPFKWLHLTYNQSDSFEPVGFAVDTMAEIAANPTGKSKDYGVRFVFLNDRLTVSLNRYEAYQRNARGFAGVLAGRAYRYDFDVGNDPDSGFASNTNTQDMFDWYYSHIWGNAAFNATTGFATATNATYADPTFMSSQGLTAFDSTTGTNRPNVFLVAQRVYQLMGYSTDFIRRINGQTITATQDTESKGYEMEIQYRTRYWNLKVTGSKSDPRDTAISPALKQFLDWRLPIWRAAAYTNQTSNADPLKTPGALGQGTSQNFFNSTYTGSGSNTRESDFYGVVYNPYNILVANLGKTRPQAREYRVSVTTSYALAGISDNEIIKNMRTGAYVNWASKAAIGYGYADPELDTTRNVYVIRFSDANKPYYDKARATMDWWAAYDFKMLSGRAKASLQFNVQNVFENGRLQAIQVNSDGTPWAYRIIDPRKFLLSLSIDL